MTLALHFRASAGVALTTALFGGAVCAQAPAAAAPPGQAWTTSANLGIFSQYVFRGLSQTNEKPALQGGFDVAHASGFYAGTWLSNISWYSDTPGLQDASASLEWDLYGGYKWDLGNDVVLDFGALHYAYPGSYPAGATKPDTTELYAAGTWKFLQLKYSNSVGNRTFGIADSRGSDYVEGNVNYDVIGKASELVGKVTLIGHVGHQRFRHFGDGDYTDWKAGASADVSGYAVGLYVTGTNANKLVYTNRFGRDISKTQVVAFVQRTF